MWPTSIAVLELQRAAAARAGVALAREPDVGDLGLEVAAVLDAAQVETRAVRPGDELPFAQRLVEHDPSRRSRRARATPARRRTLFGSRPSARGARRAERADELRLVEPVVAADEREHDLAVDDHRHRLRRRREVDPEEAGRGPRTS